MSLQQTNRTIALDGAASGASPALAGAEATTGKSQPIAATETQVDTPPPAATAITIIPPSGTVVPNGFVFVETIYEPSVNVTEEEVAKLSDNDLLTGLKKQRKRTQEELDAFIVFYDEVVARYSEVQPRTDGGRFQHSDKPTLPEAFAAIGLNYETERKRKQRYLAAMNVRFTTQKPLQLTAGDAIQTKNSGIKGAIEKVHEKAPKVDVVFEGAKEVVTVPIASLKKVPVRKVKDGDLLIDAVTGAEYRYVSGGKLSRTQTPDFLQQKEQRELAAINAKKDREAAKAEEKKHQKELRKAEAARRDLEKIAEQERRNAEAGAKKEAKLKKQGEARATKAKRTADKPGPNAAKKAAKKDLVKVARIGDTAEFGVFPELCNEYTAANATSIGTKQMCEADRDRINAKRVSTTLENVDDAATAPAQEELVEVL